MIARIINDDTEDTVSNNDLPNFDAEWNFADPGATEVIFRRMLEDNRGAPRGWKLELKTQIARALGLQRKFELAHEMLDDVESKLGDRELTRVRYLLERGRVYNSEGKADEARPLFEEAHDLARQVGDEQLAVDAAHMVALAVGNVARPSRSGSAQKEEALEWHEKALEMTEDSDAPNAEAWRGSLLHNLGWCLSDLGRHDEALEVFRDAAEWQQSHGDAESRRVARWAVGRTLRALGRHDEALETQRAIAEDFEAADPHVEAELGECLLALGREDEAQPHFRDAYDRLKDDPWMQENKPDELERLEDVVDGSD